MKKSLIFFTALLFSNLLRAQTNIETQLVYTDTANYLFTSEWQYLSTDVYLFNPHKFDQLINEMEFQDMGRKWFSRTNTEEKLEYLFVSASLKKVKFLSNTDLVYPLYNFQINRDNDKKYRTYISDNISHIRIVDNLPLYSAGNHIDAEIKVQAITNNNSDMLISLVGKQLQGLSEITNPSAAVFSLIGEFGNFLESNTRKKEYRFSSTIRLYEQKNFDTRLHSVKVFVLHTPKSSNFNYSDSVFSTYMDTTVQPNINRDKLQQLIDFNDLPVLVVCNYRSMYQMDQISGDEVTREAIDERRARLLIDNKNGLISDETYKLERDFLRFLTVFVELKNSLELYKLNQSSGNIEVTHKNLPKVLSRYSSLLTLHSELKQKYKGSPIYSSVFVGEYDEILSFARLYLGADPNLRTVKLLAQTLKALESGEPADSMQMEHTLQVLNKGMEWGKEFSEQTAEGAKAKQHLVQIEHQLYNQYFKQKVIELESSEYNTITQKKARLLKQKANITHCKLCKKEVLDAVDQYNLRAITIKTRQWQLKKDSLISSWSDSVLQYVSMEKCLRENLLTMKQIGNTPTSFDLLRFHHQRLSSHLDALMEKLKVQFQSPDLETLQKFNESLVRQSVLTQQQFDFFRRNNPQLFICNFIKPEVRQPDTAAFQFKADSLVKAVKRQLQVFRELDLIIYAKIDRAGTDSIQQNTINQVEENRKLIERLSGLVEEVPNLLKKDDFLKLEKEIGLLMNQIGQNFNYYCAKYPSDCIEQEH